MTKTAMQRTEELKRTFLPVDLMVPNSENPNEMGEQEFNLLYDNIEKMGVTDPILVRPHPEQKGKYKIIGGHHRWEVAKLHGMEEVPVTIVEAGDFDDDMERFQMVRHNIIHGKMNPKKFMDLYQSLQGKYSEEAAAELFGFADEDEFRKLVQSTANALPKEMKQSFLDASKEIRTIDDLAVVLNRLFSTYGDTVPYGYMIFDFGGQDHVWLRMEKKQKKDLIEFGKWCAAQNRTVDKVMTTLLQLAATGKLDQAAFEEAVAQLPEVTISNVGENDVPTEDYLAALDDSVEM